MECTVSSERCGGLCTGFDGKDAWDNRRKAIDKDIACQTCNDKAHKLETFSHDLVNGSLGKEIFDKNNFHKHVKMVNCIKDSCIKEGKC